MRVIIAGSRHRTVTEHEIMKALDSMGIIPEEIVSGCAKGIDTSGEEFALMQGLPVKKFPANWDKYGKAAGYKRNMEMGLYADALIAFWDGNSRGTKSMIDIMKQLEKPYHVVILK